MNLIKGTILIEILALVLSGCSSDTSASTYDNYYDDYDTYDESLDTSFVEVETVPEPKPSVNVNTSTSKPKTTTPTYTPPVKKTITQPVKSAPTSNCDPNYSGCVPIASDVDCAGGSGNGPAYVRGPVRVIGRDIYGLDRDKDGIGCE
jgi:PBP1b-binding outer membrane lipoprotein LpoB